MGRESAHTDTYMNSDTHTDLIHLNRKGKVIGDIPFVKQDLCHPQNSNLYSRSTPTRQNT